MNAEGRTHLKVVKFFEALGLGHPVFWEDAWTVPYGSFFLQTKREESDGERYWRISLYYGNEKAVHFRSNVLNASLGLDVRKIVESYIRTIRDELEDKVYRVCSYIEQNFDCTLTPAVGLTSEEFEVKRWSATGEYEGTDYYIEILLSPRHNPILALANSTDHTKIYHETDRDDEGYKKVLVEFFGTMRNTS